MSAESTERRQLSCEERIPEQLKGRLDDFRELAKRIDSHDQDERDEAETEMHEYPLAVSVAKVYRIELSTGGPGDWLEVQVDPESREVGRIEYHFNDWFDHAERTLDGDDYDVAERFASNFVEELL